MPNSEILQKAYYKAKKNGYDCKWADIIDAIEAPIVIYFELGKSFYGQYPKRKTKWHSIWDILADHDFAKTFWYCDHKLKPYKSGSFIEECKKCGEIRCIGNEFDNWYSHLQSMIVQEEPLKYIEKFL